MACQSSQTEAHLLLAETSAEQPGNKPARLIGGRTMHSGQGLTLENSMRTGALALNPQSQHKLSITHADAGALYIDESSQLQGELNHAAALRTTYARESKYGLNRSNYSSPRERYGRMAILWYSQDHLQLPPVPESSSMLAPLEGKRIPIGSAARPASPGHVMISKTALSLTSERDL